MVAELFTFAFFSTLLYIVIGGAAIYELIMIFASIRVDGGGVGGHVKSAVGHLGAGIADGWKEAVKPKTAKKLENAWKNKAREESKKNKKLEEKLQELAAKLHELENRPTQPTGQTSDSTIHSPSKQPTDEDHGDDEQSNLPNPETPLNASTPNPQTPRSPRAQHPNTYNVGPDHGVHTVMPAFNPDSWDSTIVGIGDHLFTADAGIDIIDGVVEETKRDVDDVQNKRQDFQDDEAQRLAAQFESQAEYIVRGLGAKLPFLKQTRQALSGEYVRVLHEIEKMVDDALERLAQLDSNVSDPRVIEAARGEIVGNMLHYQTELDRLVKETRQTTQEIGSVVGGLIAHKRAEKDEKDQLDSTAKSTERQIADEAKLAHQLMRVDMKELRLDKQIITDLNDLQAALKTCYDEAQAVATGVDGSKLTKAKKIHSFYAKVYRRLSTLQHDVRQLERLGYLEIKLDKQQLRDLGLRNVRDGHLVQIAEKESNLLEVLDNLSQKTLKEAVRTVMTYEMQQTKAFEIAKNTGKLTKKEDAVQNPDMYFARMRDTIKAMHDIVASFAALTQQHLGIERQMSTTRGAAAADDVERNGDGQLSLFEQT